MWRWIAAVTVLVGTFGLGMWSAFCIGAPRASIDIVWEPDESWQRVGVDFEGSETGVPTYHCDQCPVASNEPNRICTVDVVACPDQLPEDVQRVVEIARSRPSAAAGTIFDDSATEIAFVEALTEVAEKSDEVALEDSACEQVIAVSMPADELLAVPGFTCSETIVGEASSFLGTTGGCPLTVNDATACVTKCEASVCETAVCNKTGCDETACEATACVATSTAGTCESTGSQATCNKSPPNAAEAVTALLYERAREMDAKAWQLEDAGEYGLADRLRDIASEMRGSARVAHASAAELRRVSR